MESPELVDAIYLTTKIKQIISHAVESSHLDRIGQLQVLNSLRSSIINSRSFEGEHSSIARDIYLDINGILEQGQPSDRALMLILTVINSKIKEINETNSVKKRRAMSKALTNQEF